MQQIKVGIIGGAGYTAGELLRLLIRHPHVEIVFVNSNSKADNSITAVHTDLIGETDLRFTSTLPLTSINTLFLCSAHGDSKKFIESSHIPEYVKIIDLSTDYREKRTDHNFVYGLPELNRANIRQANHIANPGCFATAIQLGLLPLAKAGFLQNDIHVNAITGSTGAGVKPSATSHFSWRNNNISIYKPFGHQHLQEITQSIRQLQSNFAKHIHFIPVRGNFTRGIYATLYMECDVIIEEVKALYADYYKDEPFVVLTDSNPDLKQVMNTNKAVINLSKHGNQLLIISMIDNLLKGAAGQAVQNMNLIFGLDEKCGLILKPIGF